MGVLIDGGCKMNVHGQNGYTPLLNAVQRGHAETVEVMLEKGARVDVTNAYGQDALALSEQSNEATRAVLRQYLEHQEEKRRSTNGGGSEAGDRDYMSDR